MDYEKKYKKALERARIWKYKSGMPKDRQGILDDIFPDLAESEDERIVKAMHIYLDWLDGRKDYQPKGEYTIRDMIDWLGRQGQVKESSISQHEIKMCIEYSDSLTGEDERIRKELIKETKGSEERLFETVTNEEFIAWLEKQGEPSIKWNKNTEGNKPQINRSVLMKTIYGIAEGEWKGEHWLQYRWSGSLKDSDVLSWIELSNLEKQGEQILVNSAKTCKDEQKPTDVEPKFHEGEWVVFNRHDSVYQVEKIENYEYTIRHFLGGSMPLSFSHEDMIRAWTIQDAKDGDVLASNSSVFIFQEEYIAEKPIAYCGIMNGRFIKGEDVCWTNERYYPATKEQRDALMKAMNKAGWEFDFEEKELKKIEDEEYNGEDYGINSLYHAQRILEKTLGKVDGYQSDDGILDHKCAITAIKKLYKQMPVWSEEDEENMNNVLYILNQLKDTSSYEEDDIAEKIINWLKSIKDRVQPQNQWKPTEEQIEAISLAMYFVTDDFSKHPTLSERLTELEEQLKKLREE